MYVYTSSFFKRRMPLRMAKAVATKRHPEDIVRIGSACEEDLIYVLQNFAELSARNTVKDKKYPVFSPIV